MNRKVLNDYLSFNRDILIGVACGFLTSAVTSQLIANYTNIFTNL
jgi:hypothetical protein